MEYYDIRKKAGKLRPLSFIIGGRGIGKTYSAILYALESGKPFLYMRNTDAQMQESATQFGNPFKRVGLDHGRDIRLERESKHYVVNEYIDGEEKPHVIGYGASCSTFSNLRGVDLSDVELVLFDEFIERRTLSFNQFDSFMGMYETINRNRELQGRPALQVILLSNSQSLRNPIIQDLDLTQKIVDMIRNNQRYYITPEIYVELPDTEISKLKADTAIYKAAAGTGAAREALENEFVYDSFKNVEKQRINEFTPICTAWTDGGPVTFYKHKSKPMIYASDVPSWSAPVYDKESSGMFFRDYGFKIQAAGIRQQLYYANYVIKINVDNLLKLT